MADDRGLLCGFDLEALQRRRQTAPYDRLWQRLRRRTAEVIAATRAGAFQTLGYGSLAWHSMTPGVREAALLWRLDQDTDSLAFVEEAIVALAEASDRAVAAGQRPMVNSFGEIALAADICRSGLSRDSLQLLRRLMRDICIDYHQGDGPYTRHSGGGNIALCQTMNAAYCALTWGAACEHPQWQQVIDHAIAYLRCYLRRGCDAAGFGYEGTGYSHEVYHYLFLLAQLLFQNGSCNLFSQEPRLRQLVEGSIQLTLPGGAWLSNINDHGLLMPRSMAWLLYTAQHYRDPLHLGLWYAYQGPDHPCRPYGDIMPWYRETYLPGDVPIDENIAMLQAFLYWDADAPWTPLTDAARPLTVYAPGTETCVCRTSWRQDAVAVHLPGAGRSHASQTHRHADAGHFSIWAYGEYLAVDTGRYNVNEDQHNVVLVEGACHRPSERWGMSDRTGRVASWDTSPLCTHACVDAAAMKDCNWADRHFIWVPLGGDDCYLVVIDNLNKDNSWHNYRWQLHGHPAAAIEITSANTATVARAQARLDLTFVFPGPQDFPDQPHTLALSQDTAEWGWPYGRDADCGHQETELTITSFKRPRLLADAAGLNCQLLTVIVPRRSGQAPLAVEICPQRRLLHLRVSHQAGVDELLVSLDSHYIQTPLVSSLSEIAMVRRTADGGAAATWSSTGEPVLVRGGGGTRVPE